MFVLLTLFGTLAFTPMQADTPTARTQAKPPKQSKTVKPPTDFETDKRLDQTLSVSNPTLEHSLLWTRIDRRTGIEIEREDAAREFDDVPIALGGSSVSARAWMDAVAARVLGRWEKTEKNGYRFMVPQSELDFIYGSTNEFEEERNNACVDFLRAMKQLPPEDKASIMAGNPYPISQLPDAMRQPLQTMLDSFVHQYQEREHGSPFPDKLPTERNLMIRRKVKKGFDSLSISFTEGATPNGGFSVSNYDEKKRERLASLDKDAVYQPVRYEIKPEDAKKLPALKRHVSVNMQNATFPDVLKKLHETYGVAFVSTAPRHMPQKADVNLAAVPLGELLDKLTEIYPKTEWEWRKYGVLVVRDPSTVETQARMDQILGTIRAKREKKTDSMP